MIANIASKPGTVIPNIFVGGSRILVATASGVEGGIGAPSEVGVTVGVGVVAGVAVGVGVTVGVGVGMVEVGAPPPPPPPPPAAPPPVGVVVAVGVGVGLGTPDAVRSSSVTPPLTNIASPARTPPT